VNSWALSWGTKQWWDEDCEIQKINNKDISQIIWTICRICNTICNKICR
jgi:hypothetical protein